MLWVVGADVAFNFKHAVIQIWNIFTENNCWDKATTATLA